MSDEEEEDEVTPVPQTQGVKNFKTTDEDANHPEPADENNEDGTPADNSEARKQYFFDDSLPPLADPPIADDNFIGSKYPSWTKSLSYPSSLLLQECPSESKEFRTPALSSAHIPNEHRAYSFLGAEDILALHKCLWHLASEKASLTMDLPDKDSEDPHAIDTSFVIRTTNFFTKYRAELDNRGYVSLEGFGDHSVVDKKHWSRDNSNTDFKSLGSVNKVFTKPLHELFEFYRSKLE